MTVRGEKWTTGGQRTLASGQAFQGVSDGDVQPDVVGQLLLRRHLLLLAGLPGAVPTTRVRPIRGFNKRSLRAFLNTGVDGGERPQNTQASERRVIECGGACGRLSAFWLLSDASMGAAIDFIKAHPEAMYDVLILSAGPKNVHPPPTGPYSPTRSHSVTFGPFTGPFTRSHLVHSSVHSLGHIRSIHHSHLHPLARTPQAF